MFFKRVAAVLALVFGIAGLAVCLAGAYGVWRVKSRLDRVNDKVFAAVDRSLEVVQERLPVVQQRVRESKVTVTEVTQAVREWGAKKGQERLVTQLQIESRTEKLSGQLREADLKLDASRDMVRDVRQALEVVQGLGAKVNPASMDKVQELLASLQVTLQQTERAVDGVREFATGVDPVEDRQAEVAKLLARIVLTLSEVDRRLDDFADRLAEIRTEARQGEIRTSRYILLGALVCYGLLAWGAAGQAALTCWGWRCVRRGRSPAGQ